ncbi:hypothetical protein NDU88_005417 [Pleurodeles waltl]|uniref:Uncharacterized protein n=1 Tax=Pleurodeles waltl TaxID=8319 RepID=A0AAV7TVD6_PLEWA|nr:hypothetical protein NDU88_005417 [Pleurodeles waltl]
MKTTQHLSRQAPSHLGEYIAPLLHEGIHISVAPPTTEKLRAMQGSGFYSAASLPQRDPPPDATGAVGEERQRRLELPQPPLVTSGEPREAVLHPRVS